MWGKTQLNPFGCANKMAISKGLVIALIAAFVVLASFATSSTGAYTWVTRCIDQDGDGYGYYAYVSCLHPEAIDCNDRNTKINPGAVEYCDGMDNNCDGLIDNDCVDVQNRPAEVVKREAAGSSY